jgi:LCP family protein required for cell wall assembly
MLVAARWALRDVPVNRSVQAELSNAPLGKDAPPVFLIVGSDSRANLPNSDVRVEGDLNVRRADTILVVGVSPPTHEVRVLAVSRDLAVDMPHVGVQKLGWALEYGGAALLAQQVRKVTRVPINHYVEFDFAGFSKLVDAVGGIRVRFRHATRDAVVPFSAGRGTRLLDGDAALAYVRARNLEELRGHDWSVVSQGDIERLERQERVFVQLLRRVSDLSPFQTLRVVARLDGHAVTDASVGLDELLSLRDAFTTRSVRAEVLPTEPVTAFDELVSPFHPFSRGGAQYFRPREPAASCMLFEMRAALSVPGNSDRAKELGERCNNVTS